jgi:tetratricopeptide (TPR) repeat protein/energy-coupling factor transporter ATP-binding protein EcfA2
MFNPNNAENPFPGLRPFKSSETHLFFGRDGQSTELLKRLKRNRFLAVVGTSGSGKSSLVRAGLLPALQGGMMASAGSDWRIAIFRPGNNPIDNLAQALMLPEVLGSGDEKNTDIERVTAETSLRRSSLGLVEVARQARMSLDQDQQPVFPTDANLLVVVDQFEELFRFKLISEEKSRLRQLAEDDLPQGEEEVSAIQPMAQAGTARGDESARAIRQGDNFKEEAAAFVKLLLEAARQKGENIYVVLTMRSDYLGDCSQFWDLPEAINSGQYLIPRMTRDERRAAVTGPVGVRRAQITEPLINQLLNDAGDNPDQLPILQHALMRTWDHWNPSREDGESLDLAHYNTIGGMAHALSYHADEAYESLSDSQKVLAEKIFKALTEKGDDNREIRRPVVLQDLCEVVNADIEEVKAVIEVFRQPGRSFLLPAEKPLAEDSLIDISHESLIRGWERLAKWVNEEARSATIYRRLAATALLYPKDEPPLRDPALQVALKWAEEANPNQAWAQRYHPAFEKAMAFLKESEGISKREAADRETQLQEQLAQAQALARKTQELVAAEQQRAQVQARSARMFFWFTMALGVLLFAAVLTAIYALKLRSNAIADKTMIASSLAKAEDAAQKALDAEGVARKEQQKALDAAKTAKDAQQKALDAEGVARKERDNASRRAKQALDALGKAKREHDRAETQVQLAGLYQDTLNASAQGKRVKAAEKLGEALPLIEKIEKTEGDKGFQRRINALINIGNIYTGSAQNPTDEERVKAVESYDKLAAIHHTLNRQPDEISWFEKSAELYNKVGDVAKRENNYKDADNSYAKAADYYANRIIPIYREQKDSAKLSAMLVQVGDIYSKLKDKKERKNAIKFYREAATLYDAAKNLHARASTIIKIGKIYFDSGDKTDQGLAESAFDAAYNVYGENDKANRAETLSEIAAIFASSDDKANKNLSMELYSEGVAKLYEQIGEHDKEARSYIRAAELARQLEDNTEIVILYSKAVDAYHNSNKWQAEAETLRAFGKALRNSDEAELKQIAFKKYEDSANIYKEHDRTSDAISIYKEVAELHRSSDNEQIQLKAAVYYNEVAALYRNSMDRLNEVATILKIGDLYRTSKLTDEQPKAIQYYDRAVKVYHDDGNLKKDVSILIIIGTKYLTEEPQDKQRAEAYYNRALEVYRHNDDRAGISNAFIQIGQAYEGAKDKETAKKAPEFYDQAVQVYRSVNDLAGESSTWIEIGKLYEGSSDKEKRKLAAVFYDKAIKVHRNVNDKSGEAATLIKLGDLYGAGNKDLKQKAIDEYYTKALEIYISSNDRAGQATAYRSIGIVKSLIDNTAAAFIDLESARRLYHEAGHRAGESGTLIEIGKIYQKSEDSAEKKKGDTAFKSAVQLYLDAGDRAGAAATLHKIGDFYDESDKEDQILKAADSYAKEADLYQALGQRVEEASALIKVGNAYGELENNKELFRKAIGYYERAANIYQQLGRPTDAVTALAGLGHIYISLEKPEEALNRYNSALQLLKTPETREKQAEVLSGMGAAYTALGEIPKALESYNKAYQLYQAAGKRANAATIQIRIRQLEFWQSR